MRLVLVIILSLLPLSQLLALDLSAIYAPGDEVRFKIESRGKTIGSQTATCRGWEVTNVGSVYVFQLETTSIYTAGGRPLELNVTADAAYDSDGLPLLYNFTLDLLNVRVRHDGTFTGSAYIGKTERLGVDQPMSIPTSAQPILFDNNFAFQWELAMRQVDIPLRKGATDTIDVIIPQINQQAQLAITLIGRDEVKYGDSNLPVAVYQIDPASQRFYIDEQGRLLKAVDTSRNTAITRVVAGEKVTVESESWLDSTMKRLPGYAFLFAFSIVLLAPFAYRHFGRVDIWIVFVAAALLFWLSLEALKPLQNAYLKLAFDSSSPTMGIYLVLFGSALLFALLEEGAKLVPALARLKLFSSPKLSVAVAIGAACGAGFGLMQAIHMTAFTSSGSLVISSDLVQRFFALGINIGLGALFGVFLATHRPIVYFLIPVGVKTTLDYLFVFVQRDVFGRGGLLLGTILILAATTYLIVYFYRSNVGKKWQGR